MSDRVLRAATGVLAASGAFVSGYLTWVHYSGAELLCSTGGCATVQSSSYAKLLGVPVAALGLCAYLAVGATALAAGPLARATGASLALSAVVFGGYLLVVQLLVVEAVCEWCIASDAITTLLAGVTLARLRDIRVTTPPSGFPLTANPE